MIKIAFLDKTLRDKQSLAETLSDTLIDYNLESKILKEDPNTMDAGSIISLLAGSTVLSSVAEGFFNWLQRNRGIEIEVSNSDTNVKIKCSSKSDLDEITKFLKEVM